MFDLLYTPCSLTQAGPSRICYDRRYIRRQFNITEGSSMWKLPFEKFVIVGWNTLGNRDQEQCNAVAGKKAIYEPFWSQWSWVHLPHHPLEACETNVQQLYWTGFELYSPPLVKSHMPNQARAWRVSVPHQTVAEPGAYLYSVNVCQHILIAVSYKSSSSAQPAIHSQTTYKVDVRRGSGQWET